MDATEERLQPLLRLYDATGHPARLRILVALAPHARKGLSPVEATEMAGPYTLGTVSYHFRVLRRDGLIRLVAVRQVRGANEHFYVLTAKGRRIVALADAIVNGGQ